MMTMIFLGMMNIVAMALLLLAMILEKGVVRNHVSHGIGIALVGATKPGRHDIAIGQFYQRRGMTIFKRHIAENKTAVGYMITSNLSPCCHWGPHANQKNYTYKF